MDHQQMSLNDVLDEALGFFEAFRRLGFRPEQLLLGMDEVNVSLVLETQGKRFIAICGPYNGNRKELIQEWEKKADWWNNSEDMLAREKIWERSFARRHSYDLTVSLVAKGFKLPGVEAAGMTA